MPGPSKPLCIDPATGTHREYAAGTPNGVAPVDGNGLVPLASMQVRTGQVTRAARPVIVSNGGSFSGFMSTLGGPDATDGTWEAIAVDPYALVGGPLANALSSYLTSTLGLSATAATAALATIWANAATLAG